MLQRRMQAVELPWTGRRGRPRAGRHCGTRREGERISGRRGTAPEGDQEGSCGPRDAIQRRISSERLRTCSFSVMRDL